VNAFTQGGGRRSRYSESNHYLSVFSL